MNLSSIAPALALLASALIAGLYYAYSCSVNPGLGKLPDAGYLLAMQSINKAIQNPLFFASFFGALVLLPWSAYLSYHPAPSSRFYFLLAAALVYTLGSFAVTLVGNVPLNNTLEAFKVEGAGEAALRSARLAFEQRWNNLHSIRTIASITALVLAILACLNVPLRPGK